MQSEEVIRTAEFNPKVCPYWLLSGVLIMMVTIIGIPFIPIWFVLGLFFTRRYLARMECVLTSKVLKVKKGLLVRVEKTIPLEKITDMGMVQGPIMRAMGIEKLTVETAGQSGQGALVSLTGIIGAQEFRQAVLDQRDRLADKPAVSAPSMPAWTGKQSDEDVKAILADIRDSLKRIEKRMGE